MNFRLDLNGLRALAVALVVLFHFGVPGLTGGFVGVDIFFVISGYLMTGIIMKEMRGGTFSVLDFYVSRVNRIMPGLIVMVALLLLLGWFVVDPLSYIDLAQYSTSAVLMVSNIVFAREAGYFAPTSERIWLLHTWSLSVEWQFYLLFPFFLLIARWSGLLKRMPVLVFGVPLGLSLVACIAAAGIGGRANTLAFFMLPFRAWEMLAGGVAFALGTTALGAFLSRPDHSRRLELLGLVLIASSPLLFDRHTPWPSYNAVVPVLGTAAIILAQRGDASLLRAKVFQALGRWSYSIYLWHWPVLVLQLYLSVRGGALSVIGGIALSCVLGWLSYTLVEGPGRTLSSRIMSRAAVSAVWAGATVALALVAGGIWMREGVPSRAKGDIALVEDSIAASREWAFPSSCPGMSKGQIVPCWAGQPVDRATAVFGDSQAQMWYPRFQDSPQGVVFVTNAGCPPFPDLERSSRPDCRIWRQRALEFLQNGKIKTIIYTGYWTALINAEGDNPDICLRVATACLPIDSEARVEAVFARLYDEVRQFVARGKRVIVVLPLPLPLVDVPREVSIAAFRGTTPVFPAADLHGRPKREELIRSYLKRVDTLGAIVVDPRTFMCTEDVCPFTDPSGRSLYKDDNHIRPKVAKSLLSFLDPLIEEDVPQHRADQISDPRAVH